MTSDDYVGSIFAFAGKFAPDNYAVCGGALLPIVANTVLYAVIGTLYGGEGRGSVRLPDFRGRAALGDGTGPGLSPRYTGLLYGEEQFYSKMSAASMPAHTHKGSFPASGLNSTVQTTVEQESTLVSGDVYCEVFAPGQISPLNGYPSPTTNPSLNIWSATHDNTTTAPIPISGPEISSLPISTAFLSNPVTADVDATGSGDPFLLPEMPPCQVCTNLICIDGLSPAHS